MGVLRSHVLEVLAVHNILSQYCVTSESTISPDKALKHKKNNCIIFTKNL